MSPLYSLKITRPIQPVSVEEQQYGRQDAEKLNNCDPFRYAMFLEILS